MNSHILRIKTKGSHIWSYVNRGVIVPKSDFDESQMQLEHFILNKTPAETLAKTLISRREELHLESLAIVEVIEQKPYSEMNVIFYREFY